MTVRLFVGNLPYDATEAELRQHFSSVGNPTRVVMPVDRDTGRPRGFAFVEFNPDTAQEAIRRLNGQAFKGRPLAISEARPREERPAGSGPGTFGPRPPRPMGLPGAARPGELRGPRGEPEAFPSGDAKRPGRNFGPPAPRRDQKSSAKKRSEGPKGPIPVRTHGRIYDVDDEPVEELEDFDNFATSQPQTDEDEEPE